MRSMSAEDAVLIFFVVVATVVGGVIVGAHEAQGADTKVLHDVADGTWYEQPDDCRLERTTMGELVYVFINEDFDIVVNVALDGYEGTWTNHTVISHSVHGWTSAKCNAIWSYPNGTVGICYYAAGGEHDHDTYVAEHEQGDSWTSWTHTVIHYSESDGWAPYSAVNETNHVLLMGNHNTRCAYKIWNGSTGEFTSYPGDPSIDPIQWRYGSGSHRAFPRTNPVTNDWYMAHIFWNGAAYVIALEDFNETDLHTYTAAASPAYSISELAWNFMKDGEAVFAFTMSYTAFSYTYLTYKYTDTDLVQAASFNIKVDNDATGDNSWRTDYGPSISITQTDMVMVSCLNTDDADTEDNGRWVFFNAFNASEATWQGSGWIYDTEGDETIFGHGMSYGKWFPEMTSGLPANVPSGGWICQLGYKTSGTVFHLRTGFNCTFSPADAPEEPGPSGPGSGYIGNEGEYGEDWFLNWTPDAVRDLWIFFAIIAIVGTILKETWTITRGGGD